MQQKRFAECAARIVGLGILAASLSVSASAQTVKAGQSQAVGHPYIPPPLPCLRDIVDSLEWDAATRGPLLIVSDDTTYPHNLPASTWTESGEPMPIPLPTPDAGGHYTLPFVCDYFDRKLVGVHSLTVLTPTTMTILNDRHLPKPDAAAGMSTNDQARLLESTFTTDQWQRVCSPDGIGVGDMTATQRELYLSLLPEPFTLQEHVPLTFNSDGSYTGGTSGAPVTLTPTEREGVRFSLQKRMDWTFTTDKGGYVGAQLDIETMPGAEPGMQVQMPPGTRGLVVSRSAFGVALSDVVPARAKTSQLPESFPAQHEAVALGQDATVGDLIHHIARKTGLELYVDPRYSVRTLYVRGQAHASAECGDLLRAIALAVTGTWRRVGPAYVLTDDIEGLGVRHARILDWLSQNQLLATLRNRQVTHALADVPFDDLVQWSASDPLHPDIALGAKIDDWWKKQSADDRSNGPDLFVPMTELPATVQEIAHRQIKSELDHEAFLKRFGFGTGSPGAYGGTYAPLRTDGVEMRTRTHPVYIVPGMATVTAKGIEDIKSAHQIALPGGAKFAPPVSPATLFFPKNCPVHALLLAPRNDDEIAQAVQAAVAHGFGQLWIQTPRNETHLLETAIRLGKARGLTVQAVVRPLRPLPTDTPPAIDRNLLGDTSLEYLHRKQAEAAQLALVAGTSLTLAPAAKGITSDDDKVWENTPPVNDLLQAGNYLRCDDATSQKRTIDDLTKLAALPGLGGIVLRDIAAPGYRKSLSEQRMRARQDSSLSDSEDPLLSLGYTDSLRLACLRANGFDPIDISPAKAGDRIAVITHDNSLFPQADISLPFFHDPGTHTDNANSLAKDAVDIPQLRWYDFRVARDGAYLQGLAAGIHARAPELPLMWSIEGRKEDVADFSFGSIDDRASVDVQRLSTLGLGEMAGQDTRFAGAPTTKPIGVLPGGYIPSLSLLQAARADSRTVFHAITVKSVFEHYDPSGTILLSNLAANLRDTHGWDGVVVDLTTLSMARALSVVQAFSAKPEQE